MNKIKYFVQLQVNYNRLIFVIIATCLLYLFFQSLCLASTVSLNWDPVIDDNLAGYKIYYQPDSSTLPFQGTGASLGDSPIYIDKQSVSAIINGLDPTHPYYFAITAYNNSGEESPYSELVYIPILASSLSVTLAGNGGGSLNSNPSGIYCDSGTCETLLNINSSITLIATPSNLSTSLSYFSGWSGGCSIISGSNCTVSMNTSKNVTATFSSLQPVHIEIGNYFPSLQTAYTASGKTSSIQAQAVEIMGNLTASSNKALTIKGGYNATYSGRSGYTVMKGTLTVGSGSLVVDNLVISN